MVSPRRNGSLSGDNDNKKRSSSDDKPPPPKRRKVDNGGATEKPVPEAENSKESCPSDAADPAKCGPADAIITGGNGGETVSAEKVETLPAVDLTTPVAEVLDVDWIKAVEDISVPTDLTMLIAQGGDQLIRDSIAELIRTAIRVCALGKIYYAVLKEAQRKDSEIIDLKSKIEDMGAQLELARKQTSDANAKIAQLENEKQMFVAEKARFVFRIHELNTQVEQSVAAIQKVKASWAQDREAAKKKFADQIKDLNKQHQTQLKFCFNNALAQVRHVYGDISMKQIKVDHVIHQGKIVKLSSGVTPDPIDTDFPTDDEAEEGDEPEYDLTQDCRRSGECPTFHLEEEDPTLEKQTSPRQE